MTANVAEERKVFLVGNSSSTHVGGSLLRGAAKMRLAAEMFETSDAHTGVRLVDAVSWRIRRKLPLLISAFERRLIAECSIAKPNLLITTGSAPIRWAALKRIRELGVRAVNYSTDDPWNPVHRTNWFLRSLTQYDTIFTPRRSNIADFSSLGCSDVRYLPFAYDPDLLRVEDRVEGADTAADVLLVGGADQDRLIFVQELLQNGVRPSLVGGYWANTSATREFALGMKTPQQLVVLSRRASICLILVRRANRDGHVMRSFEAAAIGGCLVVEDTIEHRDLFGADGECVRYFSTATEAAELSRRLLADPQERARMAKAVHVRIVSGSNTYLDRLKSMLS